MLKNEKNLTEEQKNKLAALKETFPKLKEMHELKENLRTIYEKSENWREGMFAMQNWWEKSAEIFTESRQTLRRWFGEIISCFDRRTTNGMVEGINNKLKLIKRRAYGFRNFQNFFIRVTSIASPCSIQVWLSSAKANLAVSFIQIMRPSGVIKRYSDLHDPTLSYQILFEYYNYSSPASCPLPPASCLLPPASCPLPPAPCPCLLPPA